MQGSSKNLLLALTIIGAQVLTSCSSQLDSTKINVATKPSNTLTPTKTPVTPTPTRIRPTATFESRRREGCGFKAIHGIIMPSIEQVSQEEDKLRECVIIEFIDKPQSIIFPREVKDLGLFVCVKPLNGPIFCQQIEPAEMNYLNEGFEVRANYGSILFGVINKEMELGLLSIILDGHLKDILSKEPTEVPIPTARFPRALNPNFEA